VEIADQWGLIAGRTQVKYPERLPDEGIRIPRPGAPSENKDEVITDAAEIAKWFGS
jgi:hypothetical protein